MRVAWYDWAGGREAMLRFGPDPGPTVIAALPLFEEANRTRTAVVDVLRRLAARGIGGALPDLPGTGESPVATRDATLAGWRAAFASAAAALPGPVHVMAWRGGALVDGAAAAASRWHLAPVEGATAVRELERVRAAGGGGLYAGNELSAALLVELRDVSPFSVHPELVEGPSSSGPRKKDSASTSSARTEPVRIIRLDTDARPADVHLPGRPLWRAAEPDVDPALQEAVATDVAAWVASCAR